MTPADSPPDDYYSGAEVPPVSEPEASGPEDGNVRAYSVSELSQALKRTLETTYGYVRLRGELSKVTRHASGHVYLSIKDDKACLDGVIWKTGVRGLTAQPELGLEVIVTGRITTYPASSKYQIVIETMEHAGVGALLAQLERLKAKLAAEGLFDAARKKPLPQMPATIGVITSPTGAVIRDILHRIRDRWPCRVIVWPVVVQGQAASAQVAAAIRGFNAMDGAGTLPRPDLLIVARGGGSIEDLWPFNDEALARAVAEGVIPLISAVGHETDTTLIDYVSDRRAPTPTGAAEMATPVLAELRAAVVGLEQRMLRCAARGFEDRRNRLAAAARGLPRLDDLLAIKSQGFDIVANRLGAALQRNVTEHRHQLTRASSRLTPRLLEHPIQLKRDRVRDLSSRLRPAADRRLARSADRLTALGQLLRTLDPKRPPRAGFALVRRPDGSVVDKAAALNAGDAIMLTFGDGDRSAHVDGESAASPAPRPKAAKTTSPAKTQGDLF
ncbi:MAG TPA: exodeoxyribonuclease VII large subunit [Caulobacteraceae bacterium]|jgi:exodeoxyribonuclease VII large subunit|nr:exodeoxyribonuclease VII large subunit [Caulobacteraceae bacterium]